MKFYVASAVFFLALTVGWISMMTMESPKRASSRGPASVDYSESDPDPDLYANDSVRDLEREYQRQNMKAKQAPRRLHPPRTLNAITAEMFQNATDPETRDTLKFKVEAERRTGIKARRARLVIIRTDVFRETATRGRMLLPLFENAILAFSLQSPSAFGVNHSIYVGQIAGDAKSRVRITVDGDLISGRIETSQSNYQIVSAGGGGRHYILELDPIENPRGF